jgi:hypothetical protein
LDWIEDCIGYAYCHTIKIEQMMERTLAIQEKSDADLKEMKVEMKANLK